MLYFVKRITVFLFSLALILVYVPTANADVPAPPAHNEYYGYSLLKTDYEKIAYDAICEGIRTCNTNIEFTITPENYVDANKMQYVNEIQAATEKALRLVMADHPEYFWYDGDGGLSIYHTTLTTFKVVFQTHAYSVNGQPVTKDNVGMYIRQVEEAAAKALKDMPTDKDLAKIHYLHDYLAENIDYVFSDDDQTIYGALVEGKAVCAGYARAYQYLLNKAGIRSWYVTGYSISPSTMNQVAHAWNLVYLDGKCYYTDVTWDDQGETFHAYYMLSKAEIGASHFPNHPEELPGSCGHTDLDYFEVHKGSKTGVGMLTGSYNAEQLADCMKKINNDTWSCHVEDLTGGGPQTFVAWLQQNQQAVAAALGITGGFRWKISTLWDEYQVEFTILPTYHQHDRVLIGVAGKTPTCSESGSIGYFLCASCGTWFKNWNGTEEIHDKDSIKIPALDHNYNKQIADEDQHWNVCKDCGLEQADSREKHYDNNKNGKCDVCNAKVEAPTEPPTELPTVPSTVPSTTEPVTPPTGDDPTIGTEPGSTDELVTEPTGTEPTVSTDPETQPSESTPTNPSEGVTEPSQTAPGAGTNPPQQNAPAEQSNTLPFIIGGAAAAVVAVIAVVLVLKKKK